jgi:hypothetical protein
LPGAVWHKAHGWLVGLWPAACVATPAPNDAVDVWQLPQSPETGWLASCAGVGRVTMLTPMKLRPAS